VVKSVGIHLSPKRSETHLGEDSEDKLSVNMAYSAYTLDKIIPNKKANFYICGPPAFNSQTIEYLMELNVGVDNIFCEAFGPMKV
jgi:ferredoxin-NADP reductase